MQIDYAGITNINITSSYRNDEGDPHEEGGAEGSQARSAISGDATTAMVHTASCWTASLSSSPTSSTPTSSSSPPAARRGRSGSPPSGAQLRAHYSAGRRCSARPLPTASSVQLQPRLHRPDGGALRIPSAPPPPRGAGAAAGGHGASGGVHERPVMVRASQDASLNIA